jgi:chromosome segregation ATPase
MSTSTIVLTSKVNQLQAATEKLTDELSRREDKAHTESMARQQAEQKTRHLEGELSTVRIEGGILQQENIHLSAIVERLKERIERTGKGVKKAWSVLYPLCE